MSNSVPGDRIERDAVDRLLEGVQILDFQWRYLFVNPAAELHNRRPASELMGKIYRDCWPGIETTEVYSRIGRVLAGGPADQMENRFAYPDGSLGWFELRFLPLNDGVLILSVDVSERRKAEENLRNSLRRYRTLSEINQAVVRIRDAPALYQKVCEVAVRFGGFAVAWLGVLDSETHEVVPQAAAGVSLAEWPFPSVNLNEGPLKNGLTADCVRSGKVHAVDDVPIEGGGRDYQTLAPQPRFRGAAAVPFQTGNGIPGALVLLSEMPGLLGSDSDLGLLEEIGGDLTFAMAAIEQERLLRQWADAFEHSAHGIVIGDPVHDTVRTCNPAFARMMHSTREALEGSRFLETYTPEIRRRMEDKLREADETGSVRLEALKIRPDGSTFNALLDIVSVRDQEGALLYRVTTIQDQSESKRLQAELFQSQKLESLGTLSSGVAHDFNNLLAIIVGNAELLRQFPSEHQSQSKRLEAIVTAGHRGADLVKQLLTFARKTDVHVQPINLNSVVEEVVTLLVETIPRSIAIKVILGPGLPLISADPSQVHQVLLNLSVNARDAMPHGGTLTIQTRSALHDATMGTVVEVSDSGEGMDPTTRARIFEPFFTTKPLGQGTGLGLSTVFGILQGHHGWVEVDSEEGAGATFRCWFPSAATVSPPFAAPETKAPRFRGGTLLLVEDEQPLLVVLEEEMTRRGFLVLSARDAIQATALFQHHIGGISVVLSDLGLPGSDGADLFRVLQSLDRSVKFVLASGYFEPGLQSRLEREGVVAFVQKPYDLHQLADLLQRTVTNVDAASRGSAG